MDFNLELSFNLPSIVIATLSWLLIAFLFTHLYRKSAKPPIWKAFTILLIGLFTFSITFDTYRISILPIGVWIAYGILKRNDQITRWMRYRPFAWLGFWANFIFLLGSILLNPFHALFYPEDKISTYITGIEHAEMIMIHPSGENVTIKDNLLALLKDMEQEPVQSIVWYEEVTSSLDEKFPYQLIGTTPKLGSDLTTTVYLERDGHGILITTPLEQYYFRSNDVLFEEGVPE
ncbi:hypothetical protein [Litchfieldia salsa]|uniref:Uncharacterized protein n=1 Tax=Litchfieldia salsa TaxID=930152 RepID=A0A1H0QE56_9BACI|nr:hypothetical protein [Litchfieldia salsa]SDP14966.1 hypothetical protein SAMN05216565_101698 [Litchfieldia salsa]